MSQQHGTEWEFYEDDGVIVGEFPEGTKLTGPESDQMVEAFGALLDRPDTHAHVTVLRSSEPYSREGQQNLQKSAEASVEHGVTRWAVVAEGTKQMTMTKNVDIDGLTVATFDLDQKDEALAWARNE